MRLESKAVSGCVALAGGNLALLGLLGAWPFPNPMIQLLAGACAMLLHGWCAWEIGVTLVRLSALSGAEALAARIELGRLPRPKGSAGSGGRI